MNEVLTPEPIDAKRAATDLAYFAEAYCDIKLFPLQVKLVEEMIKGRNIDIKRNPENKAAADVAIAFVRRQKEKVEVAGMVIDVTA